MVVEDGWTQARVAELFRVSRPTVAKWAPRHLLALRRAPGADAARAGRR